ncbi:MAG: discoidin domain-containing protein [Isosphaeraceae bacterium]|nr:discoidin domain-containing protein [Isosphaeraceae bacterium]
MDRTAVALARIVLLLVAVASLGLAPGAKTLVPEDLARGKPATASSQEGGNHRPEAANDGDPETRWCASGGAVPQWWQVDLQKPQDLTGCRLEWEFEADPHRYRVEGSADGQTWRTLVEQSTPPAHAPDGEHRFSAQGVRFVRLTINGVGNGHWASLFDIEVYGTKLVDGPARSARPKSAHGEGLLAGIKVPPGFKVTLFAAPPDVHYPTCLVAAPTGDVFVGIDENGSIDAKPDRGRVVRCVDSDGDGKADRFNVFARMDSPRGLVYDAGTLYVLHPPLLSAYHDDDGDGVAERSEVLVKGLGFDLKYRGADHTTNGIQLGIDGWLYVAVGDYGFVRAEGRDGKVRQLQGGGIARVRPDGSGLEVFARGTRNIYDVAIDPFANVFTRDNTNDGGGWNVRLSHIIATGNYGYPSLFTNFPDEIVPPLADYGGGSPTGSLYVQDPNLPPEFGDTLYTCDWGRSIVYRHPLTPLGAGFKAGQVPFAELPRPTDMDIDGLGHIYISTWREGGFTYSGPNVGYVVRLAYEQAAASPFPDLKPATPSALIEYLGGTSQVLRVHAQRALLRRAGGSGVVAGLEALAVSDQPLAGRVAAVFTLAQVRGEAARDALLRLIGRKDLREFALRALGDRDGDASSIPDQAFAASLSDPDPRVRLQAVVALGRLRKMSAAASVVPLTADGDVLVAHAAVQALVALRAVDAALAAVDPSNSRLVGGACRVLQALPEKRCVDGLIGKLDLSRDDAYRRPILKALCRLSHREADWHGQWWGTRPDTSGPFFQPVTWELSEEIERTLRREVKGTDPSTSRWLLGQMIRNKIDSEDLTPLILQNAAQDPAFLRLAAGLLAGRPKLGRDALQLLETAARSDREEASFRVQVLRGLQRHANEPPALDAAVRALAPVGVQETPNPELLAAWRDFVRDGQHARRLGYFRDLAQGGNADSSVLGYAVLTSLGRQNGGPGRAKEEADAIAAAWKRPVTTSALLRAIGRLQDVSFAPDVRSRLDAEDITVRDAARFAARELNLDHRAGGGPTLAKLSYDEIVASVQKEKGDAALGAQLFQRQGCINCHTVAPSEPLKGPLLAGIAARYNRKELTESILRPSVRVAQGFETQKFATTDGRTFDGFVVRESGDEVEFRTGTGAVTVLKKSEIEERGKSDVSMMPNGLGDPLTVHELASILGYLESLKAK